MNISNIRPDCGYRHTNGDDVMRSVREGANYMREEVSKEGSQSLFIKFVDF